MNQFWFISISWIKIQVYIQYGIIMIVYFLYLCILSTYEQTKCFKVLWKGKKDILDISVFKIILCIIQKNFEIVWLLVLETWYTNLVLYITIILKYNHFGNVYTISTIYF